MKILICGMGEVGTHAAEALNAPGRSITAIDQSAARLRTITDTMDVSVLQGNCASAAVLREASVDRVDLLVATTDNDEVNLVTASVGKAMGAKRTVAHIRHATYFDQADVDYEKHFGIDHIVCPQYATATAIARSLRNPAALAIEHFARGRIDMHEIVLGDKASVVGRPLAQVQLPPGTRIAAVSRDAKAFIPGADTVLREGDGLVLVGDTQVFDDLLHRLGVREMRRRSVVLMGGTPMAAWLCEVLRQRGWSIRLFEADRARAEALAERLSWVTVLNADATDASVFAEEHIGQADVFIALHEHEEENIVGAVYAKAGGVTECIAVVERSRYLDLLYHIGVDRAYSPGMVAAKELQILLDDSSFQRLATLASGVDVFLVRVSETDVAGERRLSEMEFSPHGVVAAVRREGAVWVPGAGDVIRAGDSMMIIGRAGQEKHLRKALRGE
ncbi:MAG: Trk system potassium transporter TrkA [Phycisphaerales bacterium]|nr:Trk system potassium transporter TrkA [Phycisphaerales bacterium]